MYYYLTVFYYGGRAESISTATVMQLHELSEGKPEWLKSGRIYMDTTWEKVSRFNRVPAAIVHLLVVVY